MSGGILSLLGGGNPQGTGILSGFDQFAQENAAALLQAGAGLLSGNGWGAGAQGFAQGMQQDERTRALKQAQADKERQRLAAQQLAEKLGRPELADMPEVLGSLALDRYKTREPSEFDRLTAGMDPQLVEQAKLAKLGLVNNSKWEIKTVKNADGSESAVYFNPADPTKTVPVPGYGTGASKQAQQQAQREQSADIVVQDIDRALDITKKSWTPVTGGIGGQVLSNIGGTNAHNVSQLLNTVKANATFDKLQAMRAASPTGGALGAVSDQENKLLGAAIGSLEQSQSEEQFVQNLKRVKKIYNEIIHGPGATDANGNLKAPRKNGGATGSVPTSAVQHLRQNPHLRREFDAKYGPGSSAQALGIPDA
jgi:hypothetical protein